jgi:putative phosphoribosyl transferase
LGIPRGGVITGATLAHELNAELDVALARKLRHPMQPELAIGAIAENGQTYFHKDAAEGIDEQYLNQEKEQRLAELKDRREMFRQVRPAASVEGRTVIVTDDGIATGSTMFAALRALKSRNPRELIVAVPVAPPSTLQQLQFECDRVVCLSAPAAFFAIGEFYEDFTPVEDAEALAALREAALAIRAS